MRRWRAQRDACFQNIFIVAAFCGIFSPKENVRMRIDQAWQHSRRRKIDDRGAGRNLRGSIRDFLDAIAAHKNHLVLARRSARTVNQRTGANYRGALS